MMISSSARLRHSRWALSIAAALAALSIGSVMAATPAAATIFTNSTALDLAQAMAANSSQVTGASFVARPTGPVGVADARADSPLASFPTNGSDYAILTSGDATLASLDDATNGDPTASVTYQGCSGCSPSDVRGANDVTILKVDLNVPAAANCLRVDFRFLSEEWPRFVGSFNDAFIAELDTSDWVVNPDQSITAPHDFALDPNNQVVSVNNTGVAGMNGANGSGTVYSGGATPPPSGTGGATTLLQASTPITSGSHSVYFSIFDAGDHALDSAVFLDRLFLGTSS